MTGAAYGIQQHSITSAVYRGYHELQEQLSRWAERLSASPGAPKIGTGLAVVFVRLLKVVLQVLLRSPVMIVAIVATGLYSVWLRCATMITPFCFVSACSLCYITLGVSWFVFCLQLCPRQCCSGAAAREQKASFQEWESIRAEEKARQATMTDEWRWRPDGRSRGERAQDRTRTNAQSRQHRKGSQRERESTRSAQWRAQQARQAEFVGKGKSPPFVDPSDHYAMLGLSHLGHRATQEEIQKAFRREMMAYHPDHNVNTEYDPAALTERTRQILQSYRILRDPNKRAEYDRTR